MSNDSTLLSPTPRRDLRREDRAAGRAGFDEAHRKVPRRLDRGEPAARRHQIDRAAELLDPQRLVHAREIAVHQRLHIGVRDRGRGALVFADFRTHLGRERDAQSPASRSCRISRRALARARD